MKRALLLLGAAGLLALASFFWLSTRGTRADGPIILISIDTLRADHLPQYGYTKVKTPAIDALAADGVLFERAYAHAPQTLPSHVSMLTGRLPFEHGVRDNVGFAVKAPQRMLQQVLREAGFATGAVVSAYVLRKITGIAEGFGFFDDRLPAASPEQALGQVQRDGLESLAAAQQWLETRSGGRFFLLFHIYEPHKPYAPPGRYADYAPYDGEVAYADEIVGRLVAHLKGRGLYGGATIVLTSDHGEGLGDHHEQEHGLFVYDETIRVPLIVKLPGGTGSRRRIRAPVQHIDLVPTLLDLAGVEPAPGLRGRSLRPLLEGSGGVPAQGVYSEALYPRYHFGWSELIALTDERYRYIKAPREELYDLERDPRETRNIASERAQVALAMRAAVNRIAGAVRIDRPAEISADDRERLQALGYVGMQPTVDETTPGERLPDPKDKVHILEKYRRASELAGGLRFAEASALFREVLAADPGMTDVWLQYAQVLARFGDTEGSVHAYREGLKRSPTDAGALIGAAGGLLRLGRLDEAQAHAELAVKQAPAGAREALAKIALARKDANEARRQATLAQQADPTLPLPAYVDGRLRYDEGKYAEALPFFERAAREIRGRTLQLLDLHYYLGDCLGRLERYADAEPHFRQEIRVFPHNTRARAGLAMLYRAMGRNADSERAITDLLRISPTPEGYRIAADLWTMFGEPVRATGIREEARRRFGATRKQG